MWGGACFQASAYPHPKGAGRTVSKIFGTSYIRPHAMTNRKQILHGNQTRREEIFIGSTVSSALTKIFVTQMLTRDLFAVANLIVNKKIRFSLTIYSHLFFLNFVRTRLNVMCFLFAKGL